MAVDYNGRNYCMDRSDKPGGCWDRWNKQNGFERRVK